MFSFRLHQRGTGTPETLSNLLGESVLRPEALVVKSALLKLTPAWDHNFGIYTTVFGISRQLWNHENGCFPGMSSDSAASRLLEATEYSKW
jgi:hypothetical protein